MEGFARSSLIRLCTVHSSRVNRNWINFWCCVYYGISLPKRAILRLSREPPPSAGPFDGVVYKCAWIYTYHQHTIIWPDLLRQSSVRKRTKRYLNACPVGRFLRYCAQKVPRSSTNSQSDGIDIFRWRVLGCGNSFELYTYRTPNRTDNAAAPPSRLTTPIAGGVMCSSHPASITACRKQACHPKPNPKPTSTLYRVRLGRSELYYVVQIEINRLLRDWHKSNTVGKLVQLWSGKKIKAFKLLLCLRNETRCIRFQLCK